jgi:hypothetical protein
VAAADRSDLRHPPGPPVQLRLGLQLPEVDRPGDRRHRPPPNRRRAGQSRPPRRQPRQRRPGPAPGGWRRPHHHRCRPAGRQRPRPPAMGHHPARGAGTAHHPDHRHPLPPRPIAESHHRPGTWSASPWAGKARRTGPCGSPATRCCTTASARSPTASRSTPPCSTWDACPSRSPGRCATAWTPGGRRAVPAGPPPHRHPRPLRGLDPLPPRGRCHQQ